ncbi:MAG TPA: hypothetical protein VKA46_05185 [Gemmataceae bacterium]|nr:hypothetical protein [Gemmataceae bacterium]
MEHELVTVENVRDIQAGGRRWLEDVLGQHLQEHQQVFIMVLSPGRAPDEEARRQARTALEATFRKTDAYAREHGITDAEIDAAIQDATDHLRPGTD